MKKWKWNDLLTDLKEKSRVTRTRRRDTPCWTGAILLVEWQLMWQASSWKTSRPVITLSLFVTHGMKREAKQEPCSKLINVNVTMFLFWMLQLSDDMHWAATRDESMLAHLDTTIVYIPTNVVYCRNSAPPAVNKSGADYGDSCSTFQRNRLAGYIRQRCSLMDFSVWSFAVMNRSDTLNASEQLQGRIVRVN